MKTQKHPILPQLPTDDTTRVRFDKGIQEAVKDMHRNVRTDLERMAFTGGKRQTVLSCAMDSTDTRKAKFLTASSTSVSIDATTAPLVLSFADGADEQGALDHIVRLTHNVQDAWSGFTRRKPEYLYIELGEKGELSYGKTPIPPRYGGRFYRGKHLLLHCEDSPLTDAWENPHTISLNGNAARSASAAKFGTYGVTFDTSGDYVCVEGLSVAGPRFTIEAWVQLGGTGTLRYIFSGGDPYTFLLGLTAANPPLMIWYLSSNGSTWDIASAVTSTSVTATGGFHHVALEMQYQEASGNWRYVAYWDGVEKLSTTSSSPLAYSSYSPSTPQQFHIGSAYNHSSCWYGYMDEIRVSLDVVRYGQAFTAPTTAFNLWDDDPHWFDTANMKMYVMDSTGWVPKKRLFVGAVYPKEDADEIDSVRSFQPNGLYMCDGGTLYGTQRTIDYGLGIYPTDGIIALASELNWYYTGSSQPYETVNLVGAQTQGVFWDGFRGMKTAVIYAMSNALGFARAW